MSGPERARLTLRRHYAFAIERVWALWTTTAGIEAWWGPDGFSVAVQRLELRPCGELRYTMTAVGPDQVAFMEQAGLPLSTEASLTYRAVEPMRRLSYVSVADFVPGVAPYDVATTVAFIPDQGGVTLELTFDAMHDEEWTGRAVLGHESELDRLAELLASDD